MDVECGKCGEANYSDHSPSARKTYTYMPLGPRLVRIYGDDYICKLMFSRPDLSNGKLSDIADGNLYKSWFQRGGVFEDTEERCTVPLALFCDGLNPHKSMATQKSMWPLMLTWLNLPIPVRYILGPMMLVGIVPGTKTEEPKNLDPYLDVLVDELLELSTCTMYDAYKGAPTTVKVALLQYLCDVPAFSKVLHVSSQTALRGCPYCKEEGQYCKSLHKVVHLHNRPFLPLQHDLRNNENEFALKGKETSSKPVSFTKEEELEIRSRYDGLPNQNQKSILQKQTGLKGTYSFMRLPYHNRKEQMQPDGMHTIADVIGNVLGMVTGKDDNKKVRNGEEDFNRFKETWIKRDDEDAEPCSEVTRKRKNDNQSNAKQKKQKLQTEIGEELPKAPWKVDKPGLKVADTRAKNLVYPIGYDYLADNHFSKPWTLRTMHGKHQFVKSGAALWCLRGLLPKRQENTLRKLFSAIDMMTHESYDSDELDDIIQFTSEAMSLLERDFPIALQTITTHLMHHIPEGYADFGPLYGRWLFPFERINSWITRQALNKNKIEATIMETYAIYDWCVFMIMSGKIKQDDINIGKLEKLLLDEVIDEMKTSIGKKFFIPDTVLSHMSEIYDFCLLQRMTNEGKEVSCCTKLYGNTGREMKYSSVTKQRSSDTFVYAVKIGDDFVANQNCVNSLSDILFGNISKIFEHSWHGKSYTWLLVDIYDDVKFENGFWSTSEQFISQRPLLLQDVSAPQVVGKESNRLYFVSASVSLKD
ncbi:uncharacterized protein LOC127732488 [Mytilus californianus]|uniref:uncharacterized protein LOC127732488 n=1 Tax=Mytilus californianus TaxID=6549 RepID=UPI00224719DF|nr:uncharacterized protein LOC127732488 [Mytilus californianus]